MSAIFRWLLTQATRGTLGQIIKSVLEELGIWKFVVAIPIAVYVAVMGMAEGLQSVAVALMFVVAAAVLAILHYLTLRHKRFRSALRMTVSESGPYFKTKGSVYGISGETPSIPTSVKML